MSGSFLFYFYFTFGYQSDLILPTSGLQNRELLEQLLTGVTAARDNLPPSELTARKPRLVLKIAPDLDEAQLVEMASVIRSTGIDGVIVSNTTTQRPASLINGEFSE